LTQAITEPAQVRRINFTRTDLALLGVALAVRAGFVLVQLRFHVFDISFEAADSRLYRQLAESLISGDGFALEGKPTAFVTPGYSLFLTALYPIARSTVFIALVQSLLGALTVVILARLGRLLGGPRTGLTVGLIAAFYPHLVFWTGYVLTETLYVFILSGALLTTARAVEPDRRTVWMLAAGALYGLAALVRPLAFGFGFALGLVGLLIARFRVRAVLGFAGLALVLIPWVARNAYTMGSPVITSTEAGYVLWQGNSPGATGGTRGYVDGADFDNLDIPSGTSEVKIDRIYRQASLRWMTENPDKVAALVPKKLWNMWRPTYAGASALNSLITYMTYLPLLGLAVPGLWFLRRHGPVGWLIIGFVAYHLIAHGLVTGMIRFRLPVEAALIVPAGISVDLWIQRWRQE